MRHVQPGELSFVIALRQDWTPLYFLYYTRLATPHYLLVTLSLSVCLFLSVCLSVCSSVFLSSPSPSLFLLWLTGLSIIFSQFNFCSSSSSLLLASQKHRVSFKQTVGNSVVVPSHTSPNPDILTAGDTRIFVDDLYLQPLRAGISSITSSLASRTSLLLFANVSTARLQYTSFHKNAAHCLSFVLLFRVLICDCCTVH